MDVISQNFASFTSSLFVLFLLNKWLARRRHPLPPGPRGLPLIGNLLDLPTSYNFIHWAKYKEKYGPISSLSVTGQTFIILNDQKACIDILEKRSSNYANRPGYHFAILAGAGNITTILPYGNDLAMHRKNMHRFIGTKDAIAALHPMQELETRRFVLRLLSKPEALRDHVRLLTGSTILKVSHGYTTDSRRPDPLLDMLDDAVQKFSLAAQPGRWIVDVIPILKHMPSWFPGCNFKQIAQEYKKAIHAIAETAHRFARQQMSAGTAISSFESFLMEQEPNSDEESLIKWSALTLYGGGADTSISAVYSFFIAMQLYPEVQRKGQAELDAVVGPDRMPQFSDRPKLTYIEAIVKEVFRWNSVVPLNVPHIAKEDDVYEGYSIPKGSQIIANIWGISHDPEYYQDPFVFKPERFIATDGNEPELDPRSVTFGYGRRICPGKELADSTVFMTVVMCLATLNVSNGKDPKGNDILPIYEVTDALISHPKHFECMVTARSPRAQELIMAVEDEALGTHNNAAELSKIAAEVEQLF